MEVLIGGTVDSQLHLILVDGGVCLGLVVTAFAEEVLHDLLGHLVRSARTGFADDLVDHAVTVVEHVVKHAGLPGLGGAMVVGEAAVHQVGVGAVSAVQPLLGQAKGFHHGQGALGDNRELALTHGQTADDLHFPAGVAVVHPIPG